jgi:hypothetical protein
MIFFSHQARKMLFLCSCWRSCYSKPLSKQAETDTPPIDLKDLLSHPSTVNSHLNEQIQNWEKAMDVFHEAEIEYQRRHSNADNILTALKSNPSKFVDHPELSALADLALKVQEYEKLIPVQTDDDSIKSKRGYSASSLTDSGWNETVDTRQQQTGVISKLSMIWSRRLNNMNQTQGAFVIQKDTNLTNDLKLKPKWPDFLSDVNFDVIKVNKYGHRMIRTLRLTQHYIISIKNGAAITKRYQYEDISRVWLQNENTVLVVLKNEKRNMYISLIAPHILQQITTRVQVGHTEFKEKESNIFIYFRFASLLMRKLPMSRCSKGILLK